MSKQQAFVSYTFAAAAEALETGQLVLVQEEERGGGKKGAAAAAAGGAGDAATAAAGGSVLLASKYSLRVALPPDAPVVRFRPEVVIKTGHYKEAPQPDKSWRVARPAAPPSSNPSSKVHFMKLALPAGAAAEEEEKAIKRFNTALLAAVRAKVTADPVDCFLTMKDVPYKASEPTKTAPATEMWVQIMAECSVPRFVTQAEVCTRAQEDAPEHFQPYQLDRIVEGLHPVLSGVVSVEKYQDRYAVRYRAKLILVDSTEAIMDPSFVPPPVVTGGSSFMPHSMPWFDGGFLIWGGKDSLPLEWVPAGDPRLAATLPTLTMAEMAAGLTNGTIAFKTGIPGTDKDGKPIVRTFLNKQDRMGDLCTVWGDFSKPPEEQAFVVRPPAFHPSDKERTTMGSLLAFGNSEEVDAWRAARQSLYENISSMFDTKKRWSVDALKTKYALPGIDPANPSPTSEKFYKRDDATGIYYDEDTKEQANFIAWFKCVVEAPKGISQLLTPIYVVSKPEESPFWCRPATVEDILPGSPLMTVVSWGELKEATGSIRMQNHSKLVLLTENVPLGGAAYATSVFGEEG